MQNFPLQDLRRLLLHSLEVRPLGDVVANSRDFFLVDGRYLVCHSESAAILALHGVRWHDGPGHCPTFTNACRCDVEPL